MSEYLFKDLTYKIIGCALEVHKRLGCAPCNDVFVLHRVEAVPCNKL